MELLTLLKPRQLGFIYDESHPFKPDNPEIKCVFVPPYVQYNPPIFCPFALIVRNNIKGEEWNKNTYNVIARVVSNKQLWSLYAHINEILNFDIIKTVLFTISPYNRAYIIGDATECSKELKQYISIGSKTPYKDFHYILNLENCTYRYAYSILIINKNETYKPYIKDLTQFEIIIDYNTDNQYNYRYVYTFYNPDVKVYTNKPLFSLLDRYTELQTLKLKPISLRDRPNRRANLIKQFESQRLPYEIVYGFDGQCCNVDMFPPNDVAIRTGKKLYTIHCGKETFIYDPTIRLNGNPLTYGEIGCSVAHLRAYDTINENTDTLTLIFEDDAHLDNYERFFYTLRQLPPADSFDIVYLHNEATWWAPIMDTAINDCYYQTKKGTSVNLCLALLLTPNAKRIINYYHQLIQQQSLVQPLPSKYKFICLISDDLISHSARANLLRGIAPFIRNISTQHLPSHINEVTSEAKEKKKFSYDKPIHYFTDVLIKDCNDMWTGLGNQMFQYACGKLLSLKMKKDLVGNKNGCKLYVAFDNIEIDNIKSNKEYIEMKEKINHTIVDDILKPNNEKYKDKNIIISGYFQNSKYYKEYEMIVQEMFKFKNDIQIQANQTIQSIKNTYPDHDLVAVHIRRRDFKGETCEFLYDLYTPQTLLPKLEYFNSVQTKPFVYVIFSNDIQEVIEIFTPLFKEINKPFVFINTPSSQLGPHKNGCLELCIMKECDHFIISASSYSWWGAYLCKNKNKIVISPKIWYNPKRDDVNLLDTSMIACDDWIQI